MTVVACVTFGHDATDIYHALDSAVQLARKRQGIDVIAVDDSSGISYDLSEVHSYSTPRRLGFPATVQYIVEVLYPEADRVVLINPDAQVELDILERLIDHTGDLVVPRILRPDGTLENVRETTRPSWELKNLAFREHYRGDVLNSATETRTVLCPPYAPSGSVISIAATLLKKTPLRADYFWLEFSDWVHRQDHPRELTIDGGIAQHTGASTSLKYPLSVASSQARAKYLYIRTYGTRLQRALALPALCCKSGRFAAKRHSLTAGIDLMLCAVGLRDWRNLK